MSEFFHMGGYAAYVWPAYGLALLVLIVNLLGPYLRLRRSLRDLARRTHARRGL